MTGIEWLVIGGGLAVIVWLNWYFLFADRSKRNQNKNVSSAENSSDSPKQ